MSSNSNLNQLVSSIKNRIQQTSVGYSYVPEEQNYDSIVDVFNKMNPESIDKILQVAIKYEFDGKTLIFTLPRPNRHHNIFIEFKTLTLLKDKDFVETQGFISTNGFVDRVEGLKIATKANQIIKKHPSYNELYSEDMW